MKVSTETVGTREVMLTIEPDEAVVQRAMRQAARQISRVRPVQGYRPGKAPYAMVERMMGRETILNEALNDMAEDLYREAVKEAAIEPFAQGQLEIKSDDPLVLTVRIPLMPVAKLGDYAALSIEPEPPVTVSDEDVNEYLTMLQQRHAEHESVERPVAMGDQIVCDIKGVADGETVVERSNATMGVTDGLMAPGFAEALVGMQVGLERTFSLTYPEDYADDNLAGKQVEFTVEIATVRQTILPPLDDDLAKMVGDFDTLEELREDTAKNLRQNRENASRSAEAQAALEALVGVCEIEYPAVALDGEVESAINRQRANIEQMGFTMDAYLRMMNMTLDDLRDQIRPGAETSLLQRLALQEFANSEKLQVSQQELAGAMQRLAMTVSQAYGEEAPAMLRRMQSQGVLYSVYGDELMAKAQRHLTAMLTGREDELENKAEEEPAADEIETTTDDAETASGSEDASDAAEHDTGDAEA